MAPRILIYGLLIAVAVAGYLRYQATGPGPDLATTLHWIALGDGGREAELVTIHRAHEIGAAAARYAVRELEAPSFEAGWATTLASFATMNVRGWLPLLTMGADADTAPEFIVAMYRVRQVDGWGRPYRVSTRIIHSDADWMGDTEVAADLDHGLRRTFFDRGEPDFGEADHMRLELISDGPDGAPGTDDDLRFTSYFPVGFTFRVSGNLEAINRQLDAAFVKGTQYFRLDGARHRLVDARILAEIRVENLM